MNTYDLITKILNQYNNKEKQELFIDFSDLPKEEQNFFQNLIEDGLITNEYFPMSEKEYQTWKTMGKYGIIN